TIRIFISFPLWALCAFGVSPLYERGYTVMPEPQKVTLGAKDFRVDSSWRLEIGPGVNIKEVAIETLQQDLDSRFHLQLGVGRSGPVLLLQMTPNSVSIGPTQDRDKKSIAEQAYSLDLSSDRVTVKANAPAGLFYGAETLVQLLRPRNGALWLPE